MNLKRIFQAGMMATMLLSAVVAQTIQEGLKKIEMRQMEGAKKTFKAILQKDATSLEAQYYLGKIYWMQQKNDSALALFQKVVTSYAESPLGYIGQGYIYLNQKDEKNALAMFKKAVSNTKSKDPSTYMSIAEGYIYGKYPNVEKAVENLDNAKEVSKNNPKIFILRGEAYATKFDGKGNAMTNYELATDLDKNNVSAWYHIGELDARSKNFKEATPALEKVKSLDSLYLPVYPELAELYYYSNKISLAKEMYRIYLSLADFDLEAMVRYASFLYLSKDYDKAIDEIKKIQASDTTYLVFNKFLAYSYYEVGKYPEGMKPLKKYIDQTPKEKITFSDYDYYAKMLRKTGQDSLSIVWMLMAFNADTTHSEILGQIADYYYKAGKYKPAADAYQFKISKSQVPQTSDYLFMARAYYNLATYDTIEDKTLKPGQYDLADSAFKKVIDMDPSYIPAYVYRVNINVYYKDTLATTGSAVPVCDSLIEHLKNDTVQAAKNKANLMTCYKYLGTYYLKKKDCRKGKEYYLKAKELDPADKQVREILSGLNC